MDPRFNARGPRIDSPVGRLDPRLKIIVALSVIAIVVSEPRSELRAFGYDFVFLAAAVAASRVPLREIRRRVTRASPFILTAAVLLPLSQTGGRPELLADGPWRQPLAIVLKAYASVLTLSLLVLTERPDRLLGAIRSLGFPAALGSILALAGRYLHTLSEEAALMKRARESRTPGRLRASRIEVTGRAAGALFLRGLRRAQAVQSAMVARGFNGSFPALHPFRLRLRDAIAAAAILLPFIAVRMRVP